MITLFYIFINTLLFLVLFWGLKINLDKIPNLVFLIIIIISYLITRFFSVYVFFFLIGRPGPGDLNYFYSMALSAKMGQTAYNDFFTPYSILFPYITSLPLYIVNHKGSIVFLFALVDLLLLIISFFFIKIQEFKFNVKKFLWMFIFSPIMFSSTVYWAQDEIVMTLIITLAFILLHKENIILTIFILIVGFFSTKFIILYFYIPFLLVLKRKISFFFILIIAILNLSLYLYGIDILVPFREGVFPAEGNTFWHLLRRIGFAVPNIFSYAIFLILLSVILINYKYFRSNNPETGELKEILVKNFYILTLFLLSFSVKAYSFYFLPTIIMYFIYILEKFSHTELLVSFKSKYFIHLFYSFIIVIAIIADNELRNNRILSLSTFFSYIFILFTFFYQLILLLNLLKYKTILQKDN